MLLYNFSRQYNVVDSVKQCYCIILEIKELCSI